jgi:D-amino-acid dehydrogenase
MKIIVLGSGVIGTASAYYLAQAGHQVTVLERQNG